MRFLSIFSYTLLFFLWSVSLVFGNCGNVTVNIGYRYSGPAVVGSGWGGGGSSGGGGSIFPPIIIKPIPKPTCPEHSPTPPPPNKITFKVDDLVCEIRDDVRVQIPGVRVPYRTFASGDGFLAEGSVNPRLGDNDASLIQPPRLTYQYRFEGSSLSIPWSERIAETQRYGPSLSVEEGRRYDVHARANSDNRCEGFESSSSICRTFTVNHVPKVLNIEVLDDPNLGVSGNLDYDGSSKFGCDIDNPKTFKVTFEDKDGCGDLIKGEELLSTTDICGGGLDPKLSLRAVDSETGDEFSLSTQPYDVSCTSSGIVEAFFDLEFLGEENRNLEIQAEAIDILGDTSDWVTDMSWSYDGISPSLELNSNIIVGANELNVDWSVQDDTMGLSGVLGARLFARLEKGDILTRGEDYGSIVYGDDTEVSLTDLLTSTGGIAFNSVVSSSDASGRGQISSVDKVNIGKNQDGFLHFELQAVDRACNYISSSDRVEFGSPWIATRGGFVHSGGSSLELAIKQAAYSLILDYETQEQTSLSTELVTSGSSSLSGFNENVHSFYSLLPYTSNLTHGWYDTLLRRANARDPLKVSWTEVTSSENVDVSVCEDNQYVYFVDGNLDVNPSDYEELAQGDLNGCIFVVRGNIKISEGEHKSVGVDASLEDYSPLYDIVRGYFISDGIIEIEFVDGDKEVRDGLKIVGGLFATGGDTSIKLGRSLQLRDNLLFPTLIVFHDSRYMDIGRKILGDTFGGGYIHDTGLK